MKVSVKKLSICPCGFPVLASHIPLGAEYNIDPNRKLTAGYICGGCRQERKIIAVWTARRGESGAGYLPEEIFE